MRLKLRATTLFVHDNIKTHQNSALLFFRDGFYRWILFETDAVMQKGFSCHDVIMAGICLCSNMVRNAFDVDVKIQCSI